MSNSYLTNRRARIAEALLLTDEIFLAAAGEPVPLPESTDQTYPFRAHSEYYYLTGLECPGGNRRIRSETGAARWMDLICT